MSYKIGFIGCGKMGQAFLKGILRSKLVAKKEAYVYEKFNSKEIKKEFGIEICKNENEVIKKADIIFLAIKPNDYFTVLKKIKSSIDSDKIIITMAPGLSIESVEKAISSEKFKGKVIRTMPNLSLMIGEGCIAYSFGEMVTSEEKKIINNLFEKIGLSIEIKEELFDAVTGASGSSPAFVYMFIEAMADGAVMAGLPRKDAYKLIAQTIVGCGKMVLETGKHPGELKDDICSPGGTTIVGVKTLEEEGFRGAIIEAVEATVEKSRKMRK
ncbi:pyrroline-5-carboxylate reductase [Fusobacterium sp. PH5-44]|uniref:pyrroline-5-carboxylate reductase n=1 Tax=unclassified Fusobacterium TaxID=2648384 RepID=UPI003D1A9670